jgi:hypothetical protein
VADGRTVAWRRASIYLMTLTTSSIREILPRGLREHPSRVIQPKVVQVILPNRPVSKLWPGGEYTAVVIPSSRAVHSIDLNCCDWLHGVGPAHAAGRYLGALLNQGGHGADSDLNRRIRVGTLEVGRSPMVCTESLLVDASLA